MIFKYKVDFNQEHINGLGSDKKSSENYTNYIKNWYQNVVQLTCDEYEVTMNGDNVLPIVGCIQGRDFSPYFYRFKVMNEQHLKQPTIHKVLLALQQDNIVLVTSLITKELVC
ncbi:hypothetical protein FIA58_002630 [Flavobacterium jejuense]|uniref:Uncharacterized protein n=1 Tax=Flavobacterium jejuense TaxID=1544455 RepID=A0ABX0IL75_9FLAO|nr:hypothetical protein [Flavobacterium jejuense]NHN24560.1 hypothetical protein [Flavobacterium jejuense]